MQVKNGRILNLGHICTWT